MNYFILLKNTKKVNQFEFEQPSLENTKKPTWN
jgi:hypothetical protein